MRILDRSFILAAVSAAALTAGTASVQAGSFSIRAGQSAEGLGLSFAGAASGGIGLGSIGFNPATITMFPGRHSQVNGTYILPQAEFEPLDALTIGTSQRFGVSPNSGDIGLGGAFVPASYSAFQINERLWVGIATGAPFGLNSKPDVQQFGGQVYGTSSKVRTLSAAPTIGYKVTDWLSIGASVQVQYFKTTLKQALTPAFNSPRTILEGDDTSVGWRVGATITPFTGTTIGLAYRSSIRHTLDGSFVAPARLNAVVNAFDNPISANLNLPDFVTFSLSQQITPDLQAHFTAEWENWSRFRRIPVVLKNAGVPLTGLNFEYDDGWFFSGGLEYQVRPGLIVRGGIGYELSPVNDRVRTVRISDNDRLWLSAGLGYQVTQQLRLDVSYSHLFVKDAPVFLNATSGNPSFNPAVPVPYNAEAKPSIDIVSASLTYRWDTPAAAAVPVAPIVRKY
ncbi:MAG TPA: outer membrane protein transport protein [Beijerinckiaceae bacterium]|jgi:long-chain fatty acid transport protein